MLNRKPSVIICHSETIYIDENGDEYATYDDKLNLRSPHPHKRYYIYFFRPYKRCNAIFGLIRKSELKKTPLIGGYYGSDQVLLGELTLRGKIYRIPKPLFFRRDHQQQNWKANPTIRNCEAWFDPARAKKRTFPHWRLLIEHFKSINRTHLNFHERLWCYLYLAKWVSQNDGPLVRELIPRKR